MFEKLDNCPLCNSGHLYNHIICKDFTVSQEQFAIVKCEDCGFLFTNPRPSQNSLPQYYESDEYISHQNKSNSLINFVYRVARNFTLRRKLKLVKNHQPNGKLLDLGCGTGHFLKTCQDGGFEVTGIEPSAVAREQALKNKLTVYKDIGELTAEPTFDIITLWHVLEHIPDVNAFLQKVHKLLKPKGTIIVAVPNVESLDQQLYKEYWAAYDLPRHLYHFSQKTMKALMKKHSFKLAKTLPMKLDAYYVSMLSEKYKNNGSQHLINSMISGYKSNSYAKTHNNNYSSLIYIFHKS